MKVKRARTAGFCMGVSLALKKLENAVKAGPDTPGGRICTLGPIIHNPQVLGEFAAAGVVCLENPEQARAGDNVLIRAHGIPRDVEARLRRACARVEDATCPRVKKAQLAIERATARGAVLLLFGEADHPEVAGLVSYAAAGAYVFDNYAALERLELAGQPPLALASQTTQDREAFDAIAKRLLNRFPRMKVLSTICDATRQRQQEALSLANEVDVMVVVGGRESGNTRRLASLAAGSGIPAFHVETAAELARENFDGMQTAGLTAGASTPRGLIDAAEVWLTACGQAEEARNGIFQSKNEILRILPANNVCKDMNCKPI